MTTQFIKLTRVYVKKGETVINEQPIVVAKQAVAMVRPSNRLGYPAHRSTLTLASGETVDVKDTFTTVQAALV